MEKVIQTAVALIAIFLCLVENGLAQESTIIKKGLLRTQSTLSPSYNFENKVSNFYLHGAFEAYLENSVSVAGETYYYLGELNSESELYAFNHSLFFGASKHFVKHHNDFYIGLQPGVSITKMRNDDIIKPESQLGVNPLFSCIVGYNFYLSNYFHFFIQSRFIAGQHRYDVNQNLSELRISAGLGLNINSIK